MSDRTNRAGRGMGLFVALVCGAGAAAAQPGGGGGMQLPPPVFDPPLGFTVNVGSPYGLAAADILDTSGAAGQDGYPEIAVAGTGTNMFAVNILCDEVPTDRFIKIYHNKGATVAWDGSSVSDPHNALVFKQSLDIGAAAPDMWAAELAFADVTGDGDPDLVLVGLDPDSPISAFGRLLVFENLGNGFFDTAPLVNMATTVPFRSLVTADFDLDGDIDVIAAAGELSIDWGCLDGEQDAVVVFNNITNPNGFAFLPSDPIDLNTPNSAAPGDIAAGDFYSFGSGVPLLDLAMPHFNSSTATAAANLGNLNFDPDTLNPPTGCAWPYVTVAAERFGADPDWDFAAVDPDDRFVDVFSGDGSGSFVSTCADPYQLLTAGPAGLLAHGIEVGKIDHTPNPDIAVALGRLFRLAGTEDHYGAVAVLLGLGDGTFQTDSPEHAYLFLADDPERPEYPASGSVNVLVVDLDADGFDDLVVANHLVQDLGNGESIDTISVLVNGLAVTPSGP